MDITYTKKIHEMKINQLWVYHVQNDRVEIYPAIKCECLFLNLYSVAQGRLTVFCNSTFNRKLPAILYAPTFVSLVTIFTVFIDFFLSW